MNKIPKKFAGVKIPKTLRKGPVADFLGSTTGQLLIAEALAVAITALAMRRNKNGERAGVALANRVVKFSATSQESVRRNGDQLVSALRAGLNAFREHFHSAAGAMDEAHRMASGAQAGASAH